jgi:hypothetical protein
MTTIAQTPANINGETLYTGFNPHTIGSMFGFGPFIRFGIKSGAVEFHGDPVNGPKT